MEDLQLTEQMAKLRFEVVYELVNTQGHSKR